MTGFEPAAPASRTQCSTRLSYTPYTAGQRVRARLTQVLRQEKLAADGCDMALRRDASSVAASGEFLCCHHVQRLARRLRPAGCERRRRGAKGGGDAADHESGGGGAPLRARAGRLAKLPGIGPAKARAIIEYRSEAPFQKPEDLRKVKGIGDKLYDRLKDQITVGPGATPKGRGS